MGNVATISSSIFPKQGEYLNSRVKVCFHYNTSETLFGTIVRDDVEEPYRTIIHLDDGRYVLGTECQYSLYEN